MDSKSNPIQSNPMKKIIKTYTLFLICFFFFTGVLLAQPGNDACANATLITTDSVCVTGTSRFINQTLTAATNQSYSIASPVCSQLSTAMDVWYKFVAKTKFPTITVSNPGAGWTIGNVRIQLLSGTCGNGLFTEVACGTGPTLSLALTNPLTEGTMYYIRIHKNTAAVIGVNHTFDICVTDDFSKGSRMNEIFSRTVLSNATVLKYPWEITYGKDDFLWITEARGYKVYRMNPNDGVKTTVLDISLGSTFLPAGDRAAYNCQFDINVIADPPQGGLAGLALHPRFLTYPSPQNYVYISYVYSFVGGSSPTGIIYSNKLVRFYYDTLTGKLGTPNLIANLPGSNDHNSQRMIIAPVTPGGTNFLFYAGGDMGTGQYLNRTRAQNAQNVNSVEGKILRYNIDTAGGVPWIPTTNPYFSNSSVYSIGIRNNQGFAYDTALNILYGASHGPYSDDEINIIQPFKNYGHPLVIGYADGNYNGNWAIKTNTSVAAGSCWSDLILTPDSLCSNPPVGNEATRVNTINANALISGAYKAPLFSAYPASSAIITSVWQTHPSNSTWASEAWSGLDIYQNKMIPGWSKSLVAAGLKFGRMIRIPLSANGTKTMPSNLDSANSADTITYFQSTNRYRDLAIAPNGKDIFFVMDNNSATSGPGIGNPTEVACMGCVVKYSFLGYEEKSGFSSISKTIPVADGTVNTCNTATTITIDGTNNFIWVPITGPDGNIVAEINAMGQSLGAVTTSFYKNSGAIRVNGGVHYLDRNITISPTVTSFGTPVKVRLYISKAEFDALVLDPSSGVTLIGQLRVLKNNDACGSSISSATTLLTPVNTIFSDLQHGANGYVLQVNVTGFSSFYFAGSNTTLPLQLLTFTGSLQNNSVTLLKWKTVNEINTSNFNVERSIDIQNFNQIGNVTANGSSSTEANYAYNDPDVANLQSLNIFYRLKMYDKTGAYRYSNVIRVTMPELQSVLSISPNPVSGEVNAKITAAEACNVEWQIIDNTGRVSIKNTTTLKKGTNSLRIYINELAAGLYFLKIKGGCIDLNTKFQKL